MILGIAAIVASLVIAVWPLVALRRWSRSPRGQETLRGWQPAVVIPTQAAVALVWPVMLFGLPWTFNVLYELAGNLWNVPAKLALTSVFILIPGGLIIFDAAWFRLHPLPREWTLGRIWGTAGLLSVASLLLGVVSEGTAVSVAAVDLLIFAVLLTASLTAWWVVSHPVIAD
jgi:hypothetical protein